VSGSCVATLAVASTMFTKRNPRFRSDEADAVGALRTGLVEEAKVPTVVGGLGAGVQICND